MGVVVNMDSGRERPPSLDVLTALVAGDLKAVNELIVRHMDSPVALIPQLASHLIAAGGKRLRPMLTLAAAGMCGYRGQRHVALAAIRSSMTRQPPSSVRRSMIFFPRAPP